MSPVCICPCGQCWELPVDLVTFRGELALACPGCKRGLLRLLFGMSENVSAPPAPAPPVEITTAPAAASDDPGCTQPPQFGTDDEVEPEDVDGGLTPRQTLRDYEILHELGRGGMGVVYRAKHKALNRVVALKMILSGVHAGADEIARFRVEAEAIARLKHPNIVQVYDIRQQDGQAYFSLEFCGGGSLSGKLRGKPLVPKEAARIVESLARAMQAVHDAGILHRDLKPANVLLTDDGTPKITDFGLAKKLDEGGQGKTRTGAIVGTPAYMAPEQAEGKKDLGPSADIYALGAILYECLTGRPPFQAATTLDTVLQVISDEPVPPRRLNSKVPRDLEVICLKCLRKAPRGRYASAAALADDVRRYLDGEPIEARRPGILRRTWMATRKRPIYALLALLLALGLILGVIDYARSRNVFQGFTWEEVRRIWDLLWSDPPGKPSIPPRRSDGT